VQKQAFSDEVWVIGGVHTVSYVTVKEDGSDRYNIKNLQHKYLKASAWMFHGTIVDGKKGPGIFWEKELGSMNSKNYNEVVLLEIEKFFSLKIEEQDIFSCRTTPLLIGHEKQGSI